MQFEKLEKERENCSFKPDISMNEKVNNLAVASKY